MNSCKLLNVFRAETVAGFVSANKVDEAQFHITTLQDEQSEIILSSGNISVDLLHRHKNLEERGNNEAFSNYLDKPYSPLYILRVGVAYVVLVSFLYLNCFHNPVIIIQT